MGIFANVFSVMLSYNLNAASFLKRLLEALPLTLPI